MTGYSRDSFFKELYEQGRIGPAGNQPQEAGFEEA